MFTTVCWLLKRICMYPLIYVFLLCSLLDYFLPAFVDLAGVETVKRTEHYHPRILESLCWHSWLCFGNLPGGTCAEDYRLHHKDADDEWLCHFSSLLSSSSSSLWLAAAPQIMAELGLGLPSSISGCTQQQRALAEVELVLTQQPTLAENFCAAEEIQLPTLLCLDPCACESQARQHEGWVRKEMVTEMKTPCYFPPAQIFKANEVTKLPWTVCLSSQPGPQIFLFRLSLFSFQLCSKQRSTTCLSEGHRRALSVWFIRAMVLPSKWCNPNGRAPETWQHLVPRRR